jgi:putative NIF3 family GTP cyclohydrolase 1 type 2
MKQTPQCFVSDLVKAVEAIAPARLAESWDNVGLQVGHPSAPLKRVMTCLEVTPPTLAEAVRLKADAIVAHHPLIFNPLTALNMAQPAASLVAGLIRENIALITAHTNLDSAKGGRVTRETTLP